MLFLVDFTYRVIYSKQYPTIMPEFFISFGRSIAVLSFTNILDLAIIL